MLEVWGLVGGAMKIASTINSMFELTVEAKSHDATIVVAEEEV